MLKEQLQKDVIAAMKAGDTAKRTTLGMLQAAVKNRELDKRSRLAKAGTDSGELEVQSRLTDEEVIEVLGTEIKKRKESVEVYTTGGRPELAQKEKDEIAVLSVYLPAQLSEEEVKKIVSEAVAATGAAGPRDMGKVMGAISAKIKGKFDGGRASVLVKEALS